MNIYLEFVKSFLTSIYRNLKTPKSPEVASIIDSSIADQEKIIQNIKKVRQMFDRKLEKRLKIDRSVLPNSDEAINIVLTQPQGEGDFIRIYFTYCLLVMNNEAYLDLVNDNIPKAIGKVQKLIKSRIFFKKYYCEYLQTAVFYSNYALLLSNCGKSNFGLKFAIRALEIIEKLDVEVKGLVKHMAVFLMKNTQNFLMY